MVATQSVSHLAWPKIIFSVRVGGQFFKHYFLFFAIPPKDDFQSVVTTLGTYVPQKLWKDLCLYG